MIEMDSMGYCSFFKMLNLKSRALVTLCVQEVVTNFILSNLLHYFFDTQYFLGTVEQRLHGRKWNCTTGQSGRDGHTLLHYL